MLQKANIEHLAKKNFRYRILNVDNEHYLVDVDRPFIISYFFPWFLYFTSHWAIRLTEDEFNILTISRNDKQRNGLTHNKGITASGAAFVALLLSRAFPIEDYMYFNSHLLNIGLTLFVFCIVMGIRVWMSRRKIVSKLEHNDDLIKVYCVPTTLKFIFLSLLMPTISLIIVGVVCYAVIINFAPNFVVHLGLFVFALNFLLSGNTFYFSAESTFKAKIK